MKNPKILSGRNTYEKLQDYVNFVTSTKLYWKTGKRVKELELLKMDKKQRYPRIANFIENQEIKNSYPIAVNQKIKFTTRIWKQLTNIL